MENRVPTKPDAEERALHDALQAICPAQRDLWPDIAVRLNEPVPQRKAFWRPATAAACLLAAACLTGAGVIAAQRWAVYTSDGERVVLDGGEVYVPGDGSAAFTVEQDEDADRSAVVDSYDTWAEDFAHPFRYLGEEIRPWAEANAADGRLVLTAEIEKWDGGASLNSYAVWCGAQSDEFTALRDTVQAADLPFRLPSAIPERYTRTDCTWEYYLTPEEAESLEPLADYETETAVGMVLAPETAARQLSYYNINFYNGKWDKIKVSACLAESTEIPLLTGSEEMQVTEPELSGYERAVVVVDDDWYYQAEETTLSLFQKIPETSLLDDPLVLLEAEEGSKLGTWLHSLSWDSGPVTYQYIEYTISCTGLSEDELNALIDSLA